MSQMMNKFNHIMLYIREGLSYAFFESIFFVLLLWDSFDGQLNEWFVTIIVILAGLWVIASLSDDYHEEAMHMVSNEELFPSDYLVSAVVLLLIAFLLRVGNWWEWGVFLVAAGQNLRYSYKSNVLLTEIFNARQRRKREDTDNNLP